MVTSLLVGETTNREHGVGIRVLITHLGRWLVELSATVGAHLVRVGAIRASRMSHSLLLRNLELDNNLAFQVLVPRHDDFSGLAEGRQGLGTDKEVVRQFDLLG